MPLVRVRDRHGRTRLVRAAPSRRGMKFMGDPEQQTQEMMRDLDRMTGVLTQLSLDSELSPFSRNFQRAAGATRKAGVLLKGLLQAMRAVAARESRRAGAG